MPRLNFVVLTLALLAALFAACAGNHRQAPAVEPIERRVPGVAAAEPAPLGGAALAEMPTARQLEAVTVPIRDLHDLALRLQPELDGIPAVVDNLPPVYTPGDEDAFWVLDTGRNATVAISATLVYSTPVVYVWIESGQPSNQDAIIRAIDRFTQVTYPKAVNTFGSERYPGVDGDPRLHILYNTKMGSGVVGYFSSSDSYSRLANPFSNEREMFYINLDFLNRTQNYAYHDTTLAHEFQHMIHWHQDQGEDLWVNEGLSEYAQEVADFDTGSNFVNAFAAAPDLQLTTWGPDPGANGPHYGSAYLLIAYIAQRFGPEAISALVAEPANGLAGVEAALRGLGFDITADTLFADWVAANYAQAADALEQEGVYGYRGVEEMPVFAPAATHTQYPVAAQSAEVFNYATDYLQLLGEGDIRFVFDGATTTRLAPTDAPGGARMWWSNRADDANPRLTQRLDLSDVVAGTPVTLSADMWWDIEDDYDYGYLMASRDGEHWEILPGTRTRSESATGNARGPGYTGRSSVHPDRAPGAPPEWVTEQFDLSAYAGAPVWLQFSYVLDDAINTTGWLVDNLRVDCAASCQLTLQDWQSEGWLYTDNQLPQRWLVQILEFQDNQLTTVRRIPVDDAGHAEAAIDDLGNGRYAVVAISGLTPSTTLPASYTYTIDLHD
jgi:hypothetical protein